LERGSVVVGVRTPDDGVLAGLSPGQVLIGLLQPAQSPELVTRLCQGRVTAVSLDRIPRTVSRAQSMDVLSSQASVAGYQAVLVAAAAYDGYFPLLTTAAGTNRPARVLVLGAGVAGLQALATARRLGAIVTGSDVRPAARADVLSTGAAYLDLGQSAGGGGGYARALDADEQQAQQDALAEAISGFDVVITTAQVPGRRPPLLVPQPALDRLSPGAVVVDLAASELGGNVAGSVPDETVVTVHGVHVIGAGNLPSRAPRAASTAFARNVSSLLAAFVHDGELTVDLTDDVVRAVVVTHQGEVLDPDLIPGQEAVS
jgi:NAD(P) transhydrogenase subunit alpha